MAAGPPCVRGVGHTGLLAGVNMTHAAGTSRNGVPDLTATVTHNFQSLHQNKNLMGIRAKAPSRARTSHAPNLYMTVSSNSTR